MRALVLAGGDRPDPATLDARWPGWRDAAMVVAADGGARHAASLGLRIQQAVGDFDSLSAGEIDEESLDHVIVEFTDETYADAQGTAT